MAIDYISDDTIRGYQSTSRRLVGDLWGHRVRLTLEVTGSNRACGRICRWDGSQWQSVEYLPKALLPESISTISYATEPEEGRGREEVFAECTAFLAERCVTFFRDLPRG